MEDDNIDCAMFLDRLQSLPHPSILLYNLEKEEPCKAGKFQGLPGIGELFPF